MKALIVECPRRLRVVEMPVPEPGDYDALVRVEACGICNATDTHLIDGTMTYHTQYPAVLGHEGVGTVVAVGRRVRSLRPGLRVTRPCAVLPGKTNHGLASAWGGFAEYGIARDWLALSADGLRQDANHFLVRRQNIVEEDLPPVEAALAISLAEVASWVSKLGPLEGKKVVVLGTGVAGLAACYFLKAGGAGKVVALGRRPERLWASRLCGADEAFMSDGGQIAAARDATGGGADWLCEFSGDYGAFSQWLGVLRAGGGGAIYGYSPAQAWSVPLGAVADFRFMAPSPEDHLQYAHVCRLLAERVIKPEWFITHRWSWPGDVAGAFESVRRREVLKGFVEFP